MEFAKLTHFRRDLEDEYKNGQLKTLTIFYESSNHGNQEHIHYVIDLKPAESALRIYLHHDVPCHMFLIAHELSFEIETEYSEKTLVKECELSPEDVMQFLYCLFKMYDIRLLGQEALEQHPASLIMFDHRLNITVTLDWMDGCTDSVAFEDHSVADNILKTSGAFCDSLRKLLIYKVW